MHKGYNMFVVEALDRERCEKRDRKVDDCDENKFRVIEKRIRVLERDANAPIHIYDFISPSQHLVIKKASQRIFWHNDQVQKNDNVDVLRNLIHSVSSRNGDILNDDARNIHLENCTLPRDAIQIAFAILSVDQELWEKSVNESRGKRQQEMLILAEEKQKVATFRNDAMDMHKTQNELHAKIKSLGEQLVQTQNALRNTKSQLDDSEYELQHVRNNTRGIARQHASAICKQIVRECETQRKYISHEVLGSWSTAYHVSEKACNGLQKLHRVLFTHLRSSIDAHSSTDAIPNERQNMSQSMPVRAQGAVRRTSNGNNGSPAAYIPNGGSHLDFSNL